MFIFNYDRFRSDIKEQRGKLGMSQRVVAKYINIQHPQLSLIEQGKTEPRLETLLVLCSFYSLDIRKYFEREGQ